MKPSRRSLLKGLFVAPLLAAAASKGATPPDQRYGLDKHDESPSAQ